MVTRCCCLQNSISFVDFDWRSFLAVGGTLVGKHYDQDTDERRVFSSCNWNSDGWTVVEIFFTGRLDEVMSRLRNADRVPSFRQQTQCDMSVLWFRTCL